MSENSFFEQTIDQDFLQEGKLPKSIYESCKFINLSLQEADLSHFTFVDCIFEQCDFSFCKVNNTVFNSASFKNCRLLSINWEVCHSFALSFHFEDCLLDFGFLSKMNLPNTKFIGCSLKGVDFTESDLSEADFTDAILQDAIFQYTTLNKADFSTAIGFQINPEINPLRKAKFTLNNLEGLLSKYDIQVIQ